MLVAITLVAVLLNNVAIAGLSIVILTINNNFSIDRVLVISHGILVASWFVIVDFMTSALFNFIADTGYNEWYSEGS